MTFTEGTLLVFTDGEYSDYRLDGLAVVRQEFDPVEQEDSFVSDGGGAAYSTWLESQGLIEMMGAREYWLETVRDPVEYRHDPHRKFDEV